jgi:hypothetical protein
MGQGGDKSSGSSGQRPLSAFNQALLAGCEVDWDAPHYKKHTPMAPLVAEDRAALGRVPRARFDPVRYVTVRTDGDRPIRMGRRALRRDGAGIAPNGPPDQWPGDRRSRRFPVQSRPKTCLWPPDPSTAVLPRGWRRIPAPYSEDSSHQVRSFEEVSAQ